MTIRRKSPTNKSRGTKAGNKLRRDRAAGNERAGEQRTAAAEELAIAALGFIAAEPERLGRFLAITGIGPSSIRDAAREPRFLAGVLDHVAADESLLLAFAAQYEIDPDTLMRARELLAGRNWERDTP
jgi:Protein of unknown function (DUF3572)